MEVAIAEAYQEAKKRTQHKNIKANLKTPHVKQQLFIDSTAKRKVVRAGRRGGKTVGSSILAVNAFLSGKRVLYAAPTEDQVDTFWSEIKAALLKPIEDKMLYKNETKHIIEIPNTKQRIRAKTAWNADTLRGDYADVLILDEYQLMNEDAWGKVGAPMLLDNNGNAIFIYTPPSRRSRSTSKASDPMHAAKLFKKAQADKSDRWEVFHFTSHDNPHISKEALEEIVQDISTTTYRQEIGAEDIEDDPNALWKRNWIKRANETPEHFRRIVVGLDPTGTKDGDECGIVAVGSVREKGESHIYVLADASLHGSSSQWASKAVALFDELKANYIAAESNFGGDMVRHTIRTVEGGKSASIKLVHVSRGKAIRAEPVAAVYEQGRGHHVESLSKLEDEMCNWVPGDKSPNRLDALVIAASPLIQDRGSGRGT